MIRHETVLWILCIGGGFLSGSLMFSQILPKLFLNKDMTVISDDHNPGATNVFLHCGPVWGMLCLFLDLLKGFLPIYISCHLVNTESMLFSLVLAAPVLGHAIAPFHHFHGGKCIATAFGELFGLVPLSKIVLFLAGIYITFSTVLKIHPNRIRSIAAFGLFGMLSAPVLIHRNQYSIALGCLLISAVAIFKHSRYFMDDSRAEEESYQAKTEVKE